MNRRVIPLAERRADVFLIGCFLVNLGFITCLVDLAQLVVADPAHFTCPLWPPRIVIAPGHGYGRTFDPVLIAPWLLMPLIMIVRMWRREHPFTRAALLATGS